MMTIPPAAVAAASSTSGVELLEALGHVRRRRSSTRGAAPGSSGPLAGTRTGRAIRAPPGRSRHAARGPGRDPRRRARTQTRRRLARAVAARAGVVRYQSSPSESAAAIAARLGDARGGRGRAGDGAHAEPLRPRPAADPRRRVARLEDAGAVRPRADRSRVLRRSPYSGSRARRSARSAGRRGPHGLEDPPLARVGADRALDLVGDRLHRRARLGRARRTPPRSGRRRDAS